MGRLKKIAAISAICAALAPNAARACPMSIVPMSFVASDVADTATTAHTLALGAREANPMMRPFSHSGPVLVGVTFSTDFLRHRAADRVGVSCPQHNTGDLLMIVLHAVMAIHHARLTQASAVPSIPSAAP